MRAYALSVREEPNVRTMQALLAEYRERENISEEEFIERFNEIDYDYDDDVTEVLEGKIWPCMPFYVIAGRVLGLTTKEVDRLFYASLADLRNERGD